MNQTSEQLRIEMLFKQGFAAQFAGLVNVAIYAFCINQQVNHTAVALWVITCIALTLGRFIVQRWFLHNVIEKQRNFSAKLWENIFSVGAILMGSMWGIAGTLMLPNNSEAHYAFIGFMLAGNTAGAAVAYCTSIRASHSFLLPSIVPFGLNMLSQGGQLPTSMALLLVIYIILVSIASRRMNSYVVESLNIRHEKITVTSELNLTKAKVAENAKMAALGEMAGAIAHEINNPLAIIRGSSGILRKIANNEISDRKRVQELAEKIDATTVRIAKIVSGLKMFSRDAGRDPLENVALKTIVIQTLDFCQTRFKNRGIPLDIDEIDESINIVCRSAQISQVLLNLLNNAFDAVKETPAPWVRIQVTADENKVVVAVVDSGGGIPKEIQAKLMQPFFTTKKAGEGTGLGLSVAHGIMQGHGGVLKLDTSCPNTRFVMEFGKAA